MFQRKKIKNANQLLVIDQKAQRPGHKSVFNFIFWLFPVTKWFLLSVLLFFYSNKWFEGILEWEIYKQKGLIAQNVRVQKGPIVQNVVSAAHFLQV